MHQTRSQYTTTHHYEHTTTIYKMTSNNNNNNNSNSNFRTITITIPNYSYHHTYLPNVMQITIHSEIIILKI